MIAGSAPGSRSASPTGPRKRKRKGKAYRLDTLCMKLQERYSPSPDPGDDDVGSASGAATSTSGANGGVDGGVSETSDDGFDRTGEFQFSGSGNSSSDAVIGGDESAPARRSDEATNQSAETAGSDDKNADAVSQQSEGSDAPEDERPKAAVSPRGEDSSCPHCDITFKKRVMYELHMAYHAGSDPLTCDKCGAKSDNALDFYLHITQTAH